MNIVRVVSTSERLEKRFVLQSLWVAAGPRHVSNGSTLLFIQGINCGCTIERDLWSKRGQ